jgi:hypothetical protein
VTELADRTAVQVLSLLCLEQESCFIDIEESRAAAGLHRLPGTGNVVAHEVAAPALTACRHSSDMVGSVVCLVARILAFWW